MGRGTTRIEPQSDARRGNGLGHGRSRIGQPHYHLSPVIQRPADMRIGIIRVDRNRLVEACDGLGLVVGIETNEVVAATQNRLVRREMGRWASRERPMRQANPELRCNAVGDFVLNREHVDEVAIVALRPNLRAVRGGNQTSVNANPPAGGSDAALEEVVHAESFGDSANVLRLVPESESGDGARYRSESPSTLDNASMMSSARPSPKYSFSCAPVATNGNTATDGAFLARAAAAFSSAN